MKTLILFDESESDPATTPSKDSTLIVRQVRSTCSRRSRVPTRPSFSRSSGRMFHFLLQLVITLAALRCQLVVSLNRSPDLQTFVPFRLFLFLIPECSREKAIGSWARCRSCSWSRPRSGPPGAKRLHGPYSPAA